MLTPADKIRSGKNRIIQIVVTTKCNLTRCTNCTQLLPFRKDKGDMLPEVFRRAIRSLEGWRGTIAVFGGNPVTSRYFADYCRIYEEEGVHRHQRGIWTNGLMSEEKAALVRRTFYPEGVSNLNVHTDGKAADLMRKYLPRWPIYGEDKQSWHSPILMDYRDYDIPEEDWESLRENCDINQHWSAGIFQREFEDGPDAAIYFCEVAGALDGIRGTNNSIRAEPGWWKWPIERFQHQVEAACNGHGAPNPEEPHACGVPLRRKGNKDLEFIYGTSPGWAKELKPSPLVQIEAHETLPEGTELMTDYLRRRKDGRKAAV